MAPDDPRWEWIAEESYAALQGAWRSYAGVWVNHPDLNELASSKLEQLRRARSLGLAVPETLVTNDRQTLKAFADGHPEGLVCKPMRSGRLVDAGGERLFFTSRVDPDDLSAFPGQASEPYLFQALIPKTYELRVTVIGDQVFAVRLDSQIAEGARVDWRRGDPLAVPHSRITLDDQVAEQCSRLVRDYGLRFGAIDLARTPSGEHVFFELNPNGQWAWLEQVTGVPLRSALADVLTGAAP